MAENGVTQTNTSDDALMSDEALGIDREGDQAQDDSQVQSSPDSTGDGKLDFGGLPFKSMDEFVKGHKSLQEEYRKGREEVFQLRSMLEKIGPLVERLQQGQATPQAEPEVDIPTFLENFLKTGPKAIHEVSERALDQRWKRFQDEQLNPMREELGRIQREQQVDRFMADHPEITPEDEDALLEVIRKTPWIQRMEGSVMEKLEAALDRLHRSEPGRFTAREAKKPDVGLSAMKQAASSVGTKAGTKPRAAKDEFDEVLERDSGSRALWR